MMPMLPSFLIHSATLQNVGKDRDQNRTYTTVAALTRVRIDPTSKQVLTPEGSQKQLTALLLFDARNSRPAATAFTVGQYILWNGNEYRVETVDTLYDKRKLHHYEVGLSG